MPAEKLNLPSDEEIKEYLSDGTTAEQVGLGIEIAQTADKLRDAGDDEQFQTAVEKAGKLIGRGSEGAKALEVESGQETPNVSIAKTMDMMTEKGLLQPPTEMAPLVEGHTLYEVEAMLDGKKVLLEVNDIPVDLSKRVQSGAGRLLGSDLPIYTDVHERSTLVSITPLDAKGEQESDKEVAYNYNLVTRELKRLDAENRRFVRPDESELPQFLNTLAALREVAEAA